HLLEDRGDSLTDADAHRRDPQRNPTSAHLVGQRYCQPRARTSERMPQGHGSAVYIELLFVDLEVAVTRDDLRGKRLIAFEQADILDTQTGAAERLAGCGNRTPAHVFGAHADNRGGANFGEWSESEIARTFRTHQEHGSGAIADLGGIAGGHLSVRLERGVQCGELLKAGLGAGALVNVDGGAVGQPDGNDLLLEAIAGGDRALIGA